MSNGSIKLSTASNNGLAPKLSYINSKIPMTFDGSCLKQEKLTFTHKKTANIYIVYEINLWPFNASKVFMLGNSLLGIIKLTKDPDPDKYEHCGYGIRFYARGSFSLSNGSGFCKNVIIFTADMSSPMHVDNKKRNLNFW